MNTIFVFLILSSVVTTGHLKIICQRCWTLDSTNCCTEKETQCSGSKCMMLSEYSNISNVIYSSVKKTCAFEPLCNKCFSASTSRDFFIRVSGECKKGNNSNTNMKFKKLCPSPLLRNGFRCPSCYVPGSTKSCNSKEMVLCGGNELECVEYRGIIELSSGDVLSMAMKGCVTKNGCKMGSGIVPGTKEIKRLQLKCTPALPVHTGGYQ